MVLHEEQQQHQQKCCSVVGSSKRSKTKKKIPQRGLGVAQLEKLLEEQRRSTSQHPNHVVLPPPPPPPPPPQLFETPPQLFKDPLLRPAAVADPSPVPIPSATIDFLGPENHANSPLPARRFGFQGRAFEPPRNPSWPAYPIPLVNKALLPPHIELPSNQNYGGTSCNMITPCLEDERMVGMKRPWPFVINSNSSPFPCKIPQPCSSHLTPTESQPYGIDSTRFEYRTTAFRSDSSITNMKYRDWRTTNVIPSKSNKGNGPASADGGFLTLATPSSSVPQDCTECSFVSSLGSSTDGIGGSSQPFYSFLPVDSSISERTSDDRKGDVSDGVDLNLKLWRS